MAKVRSPQRPCNFSIVMWGALNEFSPGFQTQGLFQTLLIFLTWNRNPRVTKNGLEPQLILRPNLIEGMISCHMSLWSRVFKLHYFNIRPFLDQAWIKPKEWISLKEKDKTKTWHQLTPAHNGCAQAIALIMAMPSASLMRLLRQCLALGAPKAPIGTHVWIIW